MPTTSPATQASPPEDQFAPFTPSSDMRWDLRRVCHLLRRATFGPTEARVTAMLKQSQTDAIDSLFAYDPADDPFNGMIEQMVGLFNLKEPDSVQRWWIYRMLNTPRPLQEKVALFWHNRFATSCTKAPAEFMHIQIEMFRQKGLGSFRDLLLSVTKDPAMLVWLDGRSNRKGRANENYAREIMELFTLGVGKYTENDVKQLARAFTGWRIEDNRGTFNPKEFDDGEKEIFGEKGNFDAAGAIDLILKQPAAPKFLAKKILAAFVHPKPTDEQIDHYAKRLLATEWNIKIVLREIFASRMFFSDFAYRSKIKSPAELAIGAALIVGGKVNASFLREEMSKMGQNLLFPPTVKGWDGEETWINSNTVLERFNLGMSLATQRRDNEFARRADLQNDLKQHNVTSGREFIDFYTQLMFDGKLATYFRGELIEYMNRNERNEPAMFTLNPGMVSTKARDVLHLMMSMPEYQLN
jgi:uncharacterized protein (DUF1800 family)